MQKNPNQTKNHYLKNKVFQAGKAGHLKRNQSQWLKHNVDAPVTKAQAWGSVIISVLSGMG